MAVSQENIKGCAALCGRNNVKLSIVVEVARSKQGGRYWKCNQRRRRKKRRIGRFASSPASLPIGRVLVNGVRIAAMNCDDPSGGFKGIACGHVWNAVAIEVGRGQRQGSGIGGLHLAY